LYHILYGQVIDEKASFALKCSLSSVTFCQGLHASSILRDIF